METFPDNQPESAPDLIGVRLDDIDPTALLKIIRIYYEEAYGLKPEEIQEGKVIDYAFGTRMLKISEDDKYYVQARTDAEFRFGSKFSGNSKLWFRKADMETVWLEFDHNMNKPPEEYFEASERFSSRVGEYLTSREIAVPIYY